MIENMTGKITEDVYIGLTKAGVNVEKVVEASSRFRFKGTIKPDEVGEIIIVGVAGLLVGSVGAVAAIGNREQRGENVTAEKVICYGVIPAVPTVIATLDALKD